MMKTQNELKKEAAIYAVQFVESGMIVGLGTGSTTRFALEALAEHLKNGRLKNISGIPSSLRTEKLARELGIPLTTFETHQTIDLTIDGADEVDPKLNLIKGGGGALLREKVLAQASSRNIIIVDEGKMSPQLGAQYAVPIEIVPFALKTEQRFLETLGASVSIRLKDDDSIFTTDQGNYILDANWGKINNLEQLAAQLNKRAGIVEHGLFLDLATEVVIAGKNGIRVLKGKKS